jgi:amino acid efflux transporter
MMEDPFMEHQELRRTLTLWDGMALAIGSIAGSGILYLPSLTYVLAGHDVLFVWLGGTLLCLPLLFMFIDLVRLIPDGSGIEGFIARGLGSHVAATVPLLFLSIVVLGMPASALVAGEYLRAALGGGAIVQFAGALLVLAVTIITNLLGAALGAHIQRVVSLGLLVVVVALCALTFPNTPGGYSAVAPSFGAPGAILSSMLVTFWAYAGFENLTFIAGEFRNPRRDFPLAMIVAFLVYGVLAVALTVLIAVLIPRNQVNSLSGLFQLAARITPTWLAMSIIVVFALTIVQMNVASWLWGMSRLIYTSARARRLPRWFAHLDVRGLPRRAVLSLGGVGVVLTGIAAAFPNLLVSAITVASSVFVFIYLLCLLSYLRLTRSPVKRLIYALLFVFLLATLMSTGLKILYPLAVFLLALLTSSMRQRRLTWHRREERPKEEREGAPGTQGAKEEAQGFS